jgi:hypothetical protein
LVSRGFLVPKAAPKEAKRSKDQEDEVEHGFDKDGDDQGDEQDKVNEVSLLPSSIGLSVMVPADAKEVRVIVRWGDYDSERPNVDFKLPELDEEVVDKAFDEEWSQDEAEAAAKMDAKEDSKPPFRGYQREPREEAVEIVLEGEIGRVEIGIPNSRGLKVVASWKALQGLVDKGITDGTRTLSVFSSTTASAAEKSHFAKSFSKPSWNWNWRRDSLDAQTCVGLSSQSMRMRMTVLRILHYRDELEYAVGHGVSAMAEANANGLCSKAKTTFLPMEEVPRMDHAGAESIGGAELRMEELAALDSAESAKENSRLWWHPTVPGFPCSRRRWMPPR